jgi:hypothetical protein
VSGLVKSLPKPLRRYAGRTFLALEPGLRALFYENFAAFPGVLQPRLLADHGLLAGRDPYAEGLQERYSWSQVAREFEAMCEEVVRHAR